MLDSEQVEAQLLELLVGDGANLDRQGVMTRLGVNAEQFDRAVAKLAAAGLLRWSANADLPSLVSPDAVLARMIDLQQARLVREAHHLRATQAVIEALGEQLFKWHADRGQGVHLWHEADAIAAAMQDAGCRARKEILSLHPGTPPSADILTESRSWHQRLLDRGVQMRSIYLKSVLRVPRGQDQVRVLADAGVDVRLAPVLPFRLVVVDRVVGYTWEREGGTPIALEMHGNELGHLLHSIFEFCWLSAQPPTLAQDAVQDSVDGFADRELTIVRMMYEGRKDEATARALGVSLRTLRRIMTDLMAKLGARNRFHAGIRAVELGLIGDRGGHTPANHLHAVHSQ